MSDLVDSKTHERQQVKAMDDTIGTSVVELHPADREVRMTLHGFVNVAVVAELHTAAVAALHTGKDVTVGCGEAEYLDLAAFQVLCALRCAVQGRGKRFALADVPTKVGDYLKFAGLDALAPAATDPCPV
jgi:anti-anti-sigma regulatory factor